MTQEPENPGPGTVVFVGGLAGRFEQPADWAVTSRKMWRHETFVDSTALKIALHRAGLLAKAEAAMARRDDEVAILWSGVPQFRRVGPVAVTLKAALRLSEKRLDELFESASAGTGDT